MSRRTQTIVVVGGTLVVLFALLYSVLRLILLTSFTRLEEDDTRLNVERVLNAMANEIDTLTVTADDWAAWDDTYTFIEDGNEAYIESNLGDGTFYALDLNLALFVDTSGQVVFGKTIDLATGADLPLMPGLDAYLTDEKLLLHHADLTSSVSGIIRLPQATLLVAAHPILTSADEGPIHGTLIFGRLLDDAWLQDLADATRLTLTIQGWDEPDLAQDMQAFKSAYAAPSSIGVQPLNQNTVAGYAVVDDVFGNPALMLRVDMPRHIYQKGHTTLLYFGLVLLVIGVLFGSVALVLVERIVLAKERFEVILENSSDAVCLVRPDGIIELTNPAFSRAFGVTVPNAVHPSLKDLVQADYVERLMTALGAAAKTHQNGRIDLVVCSRTGRCFDADMVVSPIQGADDQVSGVVCSVRDITAQKRLEHHLRNTLEREMEVSEMKSQFVSVASHELRTPLAEILLASDFIDRYGPRLTEAQKQQKLAQIRVGVRHMTDLLDDVLTMSRIESGKFTFRPTPFDVVSYCQDLVRKNHRTAGERHQTAVSAEGDLANACLDQKLLQHILDNLLSNAFKYSPPNTTVYLDIVGHDEQVVFTVRDEGRGIPEHEQEQLYEMFFRSENVSDVPGTGLGLAIVRQAVEVHGGTITLQSTEGVGTTFVVTLPYVRHEAVQHETNPGH
jgi:PAS domain S-box-containing protein